MEPAIWARVHGATTHFPIALVLCSGALDAVAFTLPRWTTVRDLHAAGYWSMLCGVLGTVPAVFSGILLTKGSVLGHGAMRMHHLFVWPAFALVIGLATWRVLIGRRATRAMFGGYLIGVGAAAALVLAAGYWGGEMMVAP